MAKFVDKQNLVQYKYFNNLIGKDDIVNRIASDYVAGDYQLANNSIRGIPKEYRESLRLLNLSKRELPKTIYSMKEDQERCHKEIFSGNAKQARQNANRYMDILLALGFFQGAQIKRTVEADPKMLEGLSEYEKKQRYTLNREDGKFYSSFFSVPKLVLVNGDLFTQYLEQNLTDADIDCLESMLQKDVHYILNVQCETQRDYAYMIAKEESIYIQRLERYGLTPKIQMSHGKTLEPEMLSVAFCLADYLMELKKLLEQQAGKRSESQADGNGGAGRLRVPKYIDQNSIKIFDIDSGRGKEGYELEVSYFRKKAGNAGTERRTGYEMAPHTRRGHYRKYRDGKTVYVHSSVIHKEKYDGIQSAHRINEMRENNTPQEDTGGPVFTMGM